MIIEKNLVQLSEDVSLVTVLEQPREERERKRDGDGEKKKSLQTHFIHGAKRMRIFFAGY